jgi:MFS transporter, DHA2 family, multidrug resistance protein
VVSRAKRLGSLIGLALATFLIVLDYTIANVSIPYIAGDLSVSADQGTYVITAFAVGNAIVLPISGWLTERIGGVRLLLRSIVLFVLFSWCCGIATNFSFLIVSRFLQGFVSGPLIPLSQSLIVSTSPPSQKNIVLGFWSAIVIAAPVIGPLLGGWLSFDHSWPWIFYINVPFGLLSAFLIKCTLQEEQKKASAKPIDTVGFFLLAIGVSCLQIVLDKGEQFDWMNSHMIVGLSITCILSFGYFILWELMHPYPLIDFSLLKKRSYTVSLIFIGIMYAMYFGSVVLIPLWLQTSMAYNAIWAGIAVAPIGIAPLIFSFFTGKLVNKYGTIKPLFCCFLLFSLSCFYTAYFTTDVAIPQIWTSRMLVGCALTLFITPLFSLSIQDIETEKLPQATGIFHFIRALSGGFGTSIFTTMWIRRSAFHHERIGESLTVTSERTKSFTSLLGDANLSGKKALQMLNDLVDKQADMLALNDCFYLMGAVFLALILLLPLGRRRKS